MPLIASVTSFKLKSWRLYGTFFIATWKVVRQARNSGGLVRMHIRPVELRTITVWKTRKDMLAFRNSGEHLEAMKQSRAFGGIRSVTWETKHVPGWKESIARLEAGA